MIKLLIVDDEKIIRSTIAEHIDWASLGVEVIGTAKDGIEAYDMILDYYPDIVMTDIKMPGLSGLELLQKIKKVNADVEFIILSGYGEFDFAQEAMQAGVRHYLLKPCNETQIIQSVKSVMNDLIQKRAFQHPEESFLSYHRLNNTMMLNVINEGVSTEGDDFSAVYKPYQKFIDFQQEAYELCCLYYVDENAMAEVLTDIYTFKKQFAPGIPFHIIYVHQTLLFFFQSFHYDYSSLDEYLSKLTPASQNISIDYRRTGYSRLDDLLNGVIRRIRRYDTIYYAVNGDFLSICNYRNILRSVEACTSALYQENSDEASKAYETLLKILSQITDSQFYKQLASSILMLSSSRTSVFTALEATEFLLKINELPSCEEIHQVLTKKLEELLNAQRSVSRGYGSLSFRVDAYVRENLSDSNLSLKWIAEHYLYMNVDYVSKKFFKETGKKFSHYLTELRIQKAKELLLDNGFDKIQSIAESVGCGNNPQYFSQLFKKTTGVTPSNYIKYIQGGTLNDK